MAANAPGAAYSPALPATHDAIPHHKQTKLLKHPSQLSQQRFRLCCRQPAGSAVQMPIDFVGDWCRDDDATSYVLPSWTDGHCKNILSIDKYGFNDEDKTCEPVRIKVGKEFAHTGTTYTAIVTARCQPDGPVTAGELRTFEFSRYKGHLDVLTRK
jgi:hypothetical protein